MFVLNYPAKEAVIELKQPLKELMNNEVLDGKVVMKPYEVKVFER